MSVINPHYTFGQLSDTTYVSLKQLNHYYTIQARNSLGVKKDSYYFNVFLLNNSSIYSSASLSTKVKSETSLEGRFEKSYTSFRAGYAIKHFQLIDERSGISNDYKKTKNMLTLRFPQLPPLQIEAGLSGENRLNIKDSGWFSGLKYKHKKSSFSPDLFWEYDHTANRTNYTFNNTFRIKSTLPNNIRNTSQIQFKQANRDYFINEDLETERRLNINRLLTNTFHYPINRTLYLDYRLRYGSSLEKLHFTELDSSESRSRKHFEISNGFKLVQKTKTWNYSFDASLHEQQNQSSSTLESYRLPVDYTYLRKNIGTRISRKFLKNDSLSIHYRVSLFQFTTPDSNNYDDRDELTYVIAPTYFHRVNPYLSVSLTGNVYLHHLIYLSSQRSSQNHWNRIFSLETRQTLQIPNHITWQSKGKIFANYFIYDYEDVFLSSAGSMIFRGLSLQQKVSYFFYRYYGITIDVKTTWEDDGFVDWNNLIQQLTIERSYYNLRLLLFWMKNRIQIQAGPTFFERYDYSINSDDDKELRFSSKRQGIFISVLYKPFIQFNYHFEAIDQKGSAKMHNQIGSLRMNYYF